MEQYPHLDLGLETQSVHTLDELERSDALSYLGKISVGDVQVHVRHESANFSSSAFPTRHRMHLFFPRPQSSIPKRDWFHSPASPCPRKLSLLSVPYSLPVFAQSSIKARIFLASNKPQSYHDTPYNHRPDVDLHLLPSSPKKKKKKKPEMWFEYGNRRPSVCVGSTKKYQGASNRWFLLVSRKILLFIPINDNLGITGVEPV